MARSSATHGRSCVVAVAGSVDRLLCRVLYSAHAGRDAGSAFRLVPVRVRAGEVVIREGDPGDRFYIVHEGRAEVTCNGAHLREEGPGDFFGEIALLRAVPRTATVAARTDLSLYALDRDDFLFAVGAHPRSQTAVERVADARLEPARLG